ncbi:MAG: amidase, partial [Sphingomonadales bacterium]
MKQPTSRRKFLKTAAAGTALLGAGLTAACAEKKEEEKLADGPGTNDISGAERIMGLEYSEAEREQVLNSIEDQINAMREVRALNHPNALAPALTFDPRLPGKEFPAQENAVSLAPGTPAKLPGDATDIAFGSVRDQAHWLATGQISSLELTGIYLQRIEAHKDTLECFVTVTKDLAHEQAAEADRERAAGKSRGPLHGIPFGLKDLVDVAGIKATWGAAPYKDRMAGDDAAVYEKLRAAGAVLLGKTTLGAIAYGDVWFGGVTRNPFNPLEGSSGSSAGSASATAAGLVSFAIGTETLGSIVSPSNKCGTTGLRPTFGRVSRVGAMALCWSLDKIGAICRSVEDTALVLQAINGFDARDAGSLDMGFTYDGAKSIDGLRIGYMPAVFEDENIGEVNKACLQAAKDLGFNLVEVSLPELPYGAMVQYLLAEAAAAFEELTLSGKDDEMVWQEDRSWPNGWRTIRVLSAVDLINIDRLWRRTMQIMDEVFGDVDVIIGPNFAASMLTITNFTGHPQLAFRGGFRDIPTRPRFGGEKEAEGITHRVPQAFSVFGRLFGEGEMLN